MSVDCIRRIGRSRAGHVAGPLPDCPFSCSVRGRSFLGYTASTDALQELLGFLYAECCTRKRPSHRTRLCAADTRVTRLWESDQLRSCWNTVGTQLIKKDLQRY